MITRVLTACLLAGCATTPSGPAVWVEIAALTDLDDASWAANDTSFEKITDGYHSRLRDAGVPHRLIREGFSWPDYYLWVPSTRTDRAKQALSADAGLEPTYFNAPRERGTTLAMRGCPCGESWADSAEWAVVATASAVHVTLWDAIEESLSNADIPLDLQATVSQELLVRVPSALIEEARTALSTIPAFPAIYEKDRVGAPPDNTILLKDSPSPSQGQVATSSFVWPREYGARTRYDRDAAELQKAIDGFRQSLRTDSEDAQTHVKLADALLLTDRPEEAIAQLRQALQIDPNMATAYDILGQALEWKGGSDDAVITEYRAALRIDPEYAPAHYHIANVLRAQDKTEEAITEYLAAVRDDPDYTLAHRELWHTYRQSGDAESAAKHFAEFERLSHK